VIEQPPREEYWVKRDGTKIAVGDMDVEHLRNALRMVIRNKRRIARQYARQLLEGSLESAFDWEAESDSWHYNALANPQVYFPLLDGGVWGSPELQRKYGGR
jgi:hypothetical protein